MLNFIKSLLGGKTEIAEERENAQALEAIQKCADFLNAAKGPMFIRKNGLAHRFLEKADTFHVSEDGKLYIYNSREDENYLDASCYVVEIGAVARVSNKLTVIEKDSDNVYSFVA